MTKTNKNLVFPINELLEKPIGTTIDFAFETDVEFEDFQTKSNLTGDLEIMRIDDGFNAKVSDVSITVSLPCERCLGSFTHQIDELTSECQFYFDAP